MVYGVGSGRRGYRNSPPHAVHSRVLLMPKDVPHWRGAKPMLATTAPVVKHSTFSTPEQASCAQAIDRSLTTFWTLVERLRSAADQRQPIHHVEEVLFRGLLAMGQIGRAHV